jgi:Na+/H+ antiporter NhaD/arsenite permease-like protein
MTSVILCIFIAGYALIALEGWTKINKSAVAILMAVCCWTLYYWGSGASAENVSAFTKALGETSGILFFLMGAMVIVEVVDTNGGFDWVREKLVSRTKAGLLWKLTLATFFLSAVLDNMTTAIIMVMILDKLVSDRRDKLLYASMVILAANSGGAFSPIGDVTTIMLWVKGNISTFGVIRSLFLPSIVSVLVPAVILTFFLRGRLEIGREDVQAEGYSNIGISPKERIVVFLIGV